MQTAEANALAVFFGENGDYTILTVLKDWILFQLPIQISL